MTNNSTNFEINDEINISEYLSLIWHWTWLILLITLLTGMVTFLVNKQITPIYSASTSIMINEAPASQNNDYNSILSSERLTKTYSELLTKRPLLNEVNEKLELTLDILELQENIYVQPIRDTQLIEI
nr:hypothetical protein [Anaerolineaceae bacterium]